MLFFRKTNLENSLTVIRGIVVDMCGVDAIVVQAGLNFGGTLRNFFTRGAKSP